MTRRWRKRIRWFAALAFLPIALAIVAFPGAHWVVRLHAALLVGFDPWTAGREPESDRDRLVSYLVEAERGGDLAWVVSKTTHLRLSADDSRAVAAVLGRRFAGAGVHLEQPGQRAEVAAHLAFLALRGLGSEGSNSYFSMLLATSAALVEDRPLLFASLDHVRVHNGYRDYATFEPSVLQRWLVGRTGYLGERFAAPYSVDATDIGHLEGLGLVASKVRESDAPSSASIALLSLTDRIFDNARHAGELRLCARTLETMTLLKGGSLDQGAPAMAFRHVMDPVSQNTYRSLTASLATRVAKSNDALNDVLARRALEQGETMAGPHRRALGLLGVLGALCIAVVSGPLRWAARVGFRSHSGVVSVSAVAAASLWLGSMGTWSLSLGLLPIPLGLAFALRHLRLGPWALCALAVASLVACAGTVFLAQVAGSQPWLALAMGVPSLLAGGAALAGIEKGDRMLVFIPLSASLAGYAWLSGQELRDNASFAAMQSRWRYDVMMAKRAADQVTEPSTNRQVG